MVDISGMGGKPPHDPFEKIRVHQIEKDKRSKEEEEKIAEEYKKRARMGGVLWAKFLLLCKKLIDVFYKPSQVEKQVVLGTIVKTIEQLKKDLSQLMMEDHSQDLEFLKHFSKSWYAVIESAAHLPNESSFYIQIESFIEDMQDYPQEGEHSLGYYLSEYAGSEWLPFPFMEIIGDLHRESKKNKEASKLHHWVTFLSNLINEIRSQEINQ